MSADLQNKKAPSFTLLSSEKTPISLRDYKDKFVMVYFYPKDETSGCTIEALAFKEKYWEITDLDVVLLGISTDDVKSHCSFINHHDLPYPLLSDINHEVSERYGVWIQKTMNGHEYWGIERTTFIIDPQGIIRDIIQNIKPNEHPQRAVEKVLSIKY